MAAEDVVAAGYWTEEGSRASTSSEARLLLVPGIGCLLLLVLLEKTPENYYYMYTVHCTVYIYLCQVYRYSEYGLHKVRCLSYLLRTMHSIVFRGLDKRSERYRKDKQLKQEEKTRKRK